MRLSPRLIASRGLAAAVLVLALLAPPLGARSVLTASAQARRALGPEWRTLLEILQETSIYWKQQGKAFVAFVEPAEELPAWN